MHLPISHGIFPQLDEKHFSPFPIFNKTVIESTLLPSVTIIYLD
jgi:hypothetical protein